jgi:hypothetical protein
MAEENGTVAATGNEPGPAPESGTTADTGSQTQGNSNDGNGSPLSAEAVLAGLEPDNREWLAKAGYDIANPEGLGKLAKQVYAQEKLLGNAIRIPGKDATPEQREEFLNKLGRPQSPDGYEFAPPKDLPEELPYDGERAKEFKAFAHSIGLTAEQAANVHDWAAGNAVNDFQKQSSAQQEVTAARAAAETEKLVKLWGPLEGQTAQANLQMADKFLTEAGGPEVMQELQERGLIGENKVVLSAGLAQLFANAGMALYREDGVLHGSPDKIGNPFAEGPNNNLTEQMRVVKSDPDQAKSLIFAAGKKPEDFGLKS